MRTADDSQPSEVDSDQDTQLGDGYAVDVSPDDLSDGYGDTFDDDYDDEVTAGTDDLDETLDDMGLDQDEVADLSESEAEDVLVDVVESQGFTTDEAEDVVDDVQAETGLTAGELLEDLVGNDGDDAGSSFLEDEPAFEGSEAHVAFDFDIDS